MNELDDDTYIDDLNTQVRKHPMSFAKCITKDILALHRRAYPFDTHLDAISTRFQFGADFAADDFKPNLSTWKRCFAWNVLRWIAPKGKNEPFNNHVNRYGFNLGFGGAVSCGHANLNNFFNRIAGDPWENIEDEFDNLTNEIIQNPSVQLCTSSAEVRKAKSTGIRSLVFAVEGAHSLGALPKITQRDLGQHQEKRLKNLKKLKRCFGAVYLTLDHYCATDVSRATIATNISSPWYYKTHNLTPFGEILVKTAFDEGLLIDLAHSTKASIAKVCELANKRGVPVFASHAGSRSVMRGIQGVSNQRTKRMFDDESIKCIVSTGGCIGVIIGTQFLTNLRYSNFRWANDAYLSVFLEHYEKLANLIGNFQGVDNPWDHLCFGTDFDGGLASIPWELRGGQDLPLITLAMLERGWPEERIEKVYSGNFLRVWEKAEAAKVPQV